MITIEFYWNDLTEEKQAKIQELLGMDSDDDGNWNAVPIAMLDVEED